MSSFDVVVLKSLDSSADEQPPRPMKEKREKPPSTTGAEQINEITEDRASISSTDMLVSNIAFCIGLGAAVGPVCFDFS